MRLLKIFAGMLAAAMFMLSAVSGFGFADDTIATSGGTSSDETSDTTTSSYVSDAPVSSDIPVSSDTSEPDTDPIIDEETGLMFKMLSNGTYMVGCPEENREKLVGELIIPSEYNGIKVTELGALGTGCAFTECNNITSVIISEGIRNLNGSFFHCVNLKEMYLPQSVHGVNRFELGIGNCPKLTDIYIDEDNEFICSIDGVVYSKDKTSLILYPEGREDEHYTVPDFVTTLSRRSFADCNNLVSVATSENVIKIEEEAFYRCENLETIYISESVSELGDFTCGFVWGCLNFKEVIVTDENQKYCSVNGVLFSKDMTRMLIYPFAKTDEVYTVPDGVMYTEVIYNLYIDVVILPKSLKQLGQIVPHEGFEIRYNGTVNEWNEVDDNSEFSKYTTITCTDGVIDNRLPHIDAKDPLSFENEDMSVNFNAGVTQDVADATNKLSSAEIKEIKEVIDNVSVTASVEAGFDTSISLYVTPNVSVPSDVFKTNIALDLTFKNSDGEKVQPQKPVTVKIPVPERFKDSSTIYVYHIGDDNKTEKIDAEVRTFDEVEYVVFEASKFSTYVLTDVEVKSSSDTSGTTSGDTSSSTSSGTSTPATSTPTTSEPTSSGTSDPNTSEPTIDDNTSSGSGETSNPTSSDNTSSTSTPTNGDVSQGVTSGNNVPKAEIKTPNGSLAEAVLTAAELEQYKKGADLGVTLEVRSAESSVSYSDKLIVEKTLSKFGYKLGRYLDLQLFKTLDKGNKTQIKETNLPITVSFEIPEALRAAGREYVMIRIHNGEADVLKDYDNNANTITIRTDKFSVYALAYSESSASVDNSQNGANNPYTGSNSPTAIYLTVGVISLIVFVALCLFTGKNGMTEEQKERKFAKLITWGKRGGRIRAAVALTVIFLLLSFYYGIGMKTSEN